MELIPQIALYVLLFIAGVLSFFSPSVVSHAPVRTGENGWGVGHAALVAIGLIATLAALGALAALVGGLIAAPRLLVIRIAGVVIVALGLLQLAPTRAGLMQTEHLLPAPAAQMRNTPLGALYRGFRMVLGWVPHYTPLVIITLVVALSMRDVGVGALCGLVFAAGTALVLLVSASSSNRTPEAFGRGVWVLRHAARTTGAVALVIGFMLLTGWMNGVTSYLTPVEPEPAPVEEPASEEAPEPAASEAEGDVNLAQPAAVVEAPDFVLVDAQGVEHALSDLRGDIVVVMFWSTLSPAAESALPEFQAFYDNTQRAAAERAAEAEREAQAAALAASNTETTEMTEEAAEDEFVSASEAHVTILTVVMPSDELGIDFDVPPEPLATSEAAASAASSAETAAAELTPEQQREQMLRALHDATAEEVAAKIAEAEYTFPVLFDTTGDVFAAYRTTELPCTYVITPDGVIAGRVVGALTASQLDRIVQEGVQSYDARQLELIEMQKAASTASALAASIVNTASEDATSEEEAAS